MDLLENNIKKSPMLIYSFKELEQSKIQKRTNKFDKIKYFGSDIPLISPIEYNEDNKNIYNLYNYIYYIKYINKFNYNILGKLIIKIKNKYFKDVTSSDKNIMNRVNNFYSSQQDYKEINTGNFNNIKSIIMLQYMLAKYYTNTIGYLTNDNIEIIETSIIPRIDDKSIKIFIEQYINNIKILKKDEDKKDIVFESKEEESMYNYLKDNLERMISDLLIYDKNVCAYGSYTSYLLNNNVKYNDIDIYHNNSYKFSICLMCCLYFITNEAVTLFHIPMITGHLSLKYKKNILLDIIYIDNITLQYLKPISILKRLNIHPVLQFLNNIRMNNELFRLYNIYKNKENTILKQTVLLEYIKASVIKDKINIPNISLNYKIYDNIIVFDLQNIYKLIPLIDNSNSIKYIVVVLNHPDNMINFITHNNIEGKFSKKFHAFNNELMFETDIDIKNKQDILSTKNTLILDNKLNNKQEYNFNIVYNVIKNYKTLIITSSTSTLYLTTNHIHELSQNSIFSIFVSYLWLHDLENKELFFEVLLQLMAIPISNLKKYYTIPRTKLKGEHKNISIFPPSFRSIDFYKDTGEEYYTKEEFINNINYLL